MVSLATQLAELANNLSIEQAIENLKQDIAEQKNAGVLVVLDGSEESVRYAYIAKTATAQLSEFKSAPYSCICYILDDELYEGVEKQELLTMLELRQSIALHIDDALDELVLEAEYSYKKLGMSRHMSIQTKRQLRYELAIKTASAIALDMNLKLLSGPVTD